MKIENISKYFLEFQGDTLVLHPKENLLGTFLTEDEILLVNLIKSKIKKCCVKKDEILISNKMKYRSVLIDIWKTLEVQKILNTTLFNVKTQQDNKNGFSWLSDLGISFQSKDANSTFKEILNQINENQLSIFIEIELEDGQIIKYKNEVSSKYQLEDVKPYFLKIRDFMGITNQTINLKNELLKVSNEFLFEIGFEKKEFDYWICNQKNWFNVLELEKDCFFQIQHFEKSKGIFNLSSLKTFLLDCLEKEVLPMDYQDYLSVLGISLENLYQKLKNSV